MCQFVYERSLGVIGQKCRIAESLFENALDGKLEIDLPHDEFGYCMFHSMDIPWKRNNEITKYLRSLILEVDRQRASDRGICTSMQELVLCASISQKRIELLDLTLTRGLDLRYCTFLDDVYIQRLEMPNGQLVLDWCVFEKDLTILQSRVSALHFKNSRINSGVFSKFEILKDKAYFQDFTCENEFTFNGSANGISFNGAIFNGVNTRYFQPDALIDFWGMVIEEEADFSKATFHGEVKFRNCKIKSAKFIETTFSNTQLTTFSKIKLEADSQWIFQGKGGQSKMFNNKTIFQFDESDIQGILMFENVNFSYLLPEWRLLLMSMQKTGRVQIGSGCLKYRHQTKLKSVENSTTNIDLHEDIAKTFAAYFSSNIGINLGVEILEKTKRCISYFYFTDDDLSEEELKAFFWIANGFYWDLQHESALKTLVGITPENQKNVFNFINLIGIFLKMGCAFTSNPPSSEDLVQFANATSFDETSTLNPEKIVPFVQYAIKFVFENMTIHELNLDRSIFVGGDVHGTIRQGENIEQGGNGSDII